MFISLCVACVAVPSEVLSEDGEKVLSSIEPSLLSPNTLKPLLFPQPLKHLHQKCFLLKNSHPWSVRSNLVSSWDWSKSVTLSNSQTLLIPVLWLSKNYIPTSFLYRNLDPLKVTHESWRTYSTFLLTPLLNRGYSEWCPDVESFPEVFSSVCPDL